MNILDDDDSSTNLEYANYDNNNEIMTLKANLSNDIYTTYDKLNNKYSMEEDNKNLAKSISPRGSKLNIVLEVEENNKNLAKSISPQGSKSNNKISIDTNDENTVDPSYFNKYEEINEVKTNLFYILSLDFRLIMDTNHNYYKYNKFIFDSKYAKYQKEIKGKRLIIQSFYFDDKNKKVIHGNKEYVFVPANVPGNDVVFNYDNKYIIYHKEKKNKGIMKIRYKKENKEENKEENTIDNEEEKLLNLEEFLAKINEPEKRNILKQSQSIKKEEKDEEKRSNKKISKLKKSKTNSNSNNTGSAKNEIKDDKKYISKKLLNEINLESDNSTPSYKTMTISEHSEIKNDSKSSNLSHMVKTDKSETETEQKEKFYLINKENYYTRFFYFHYNKEIDGIYNMHKKIFLGVNKKIRFEEGLEGLKKIDSYINDNNDLKCHIIYKNFIENEICENTPLILEVKGGFRIIDLLNQLKQCAKFFGRYSCDEKINIPKYGIGLICHNYQENYKQQIDLLYTPYQFNEKINYITHLTNIFEECQFKVIIGVFINGKIINYPLYKEDWKIEEKDLSKRVDLKYMNEATNLKKTDKEIDKIENQFKDIYKSLTYVGKVPVTKIHEINKEHNKMNEEILQEIENFGASESLKEKIKTIMNN